MSVIKRQNMLVIRELNMLGIQELKKLVGQELCQVAPAGKGRLTHATAQFYLTAGLRRRIGPVRLKAREGEGRDSAQA